MQLSVEAQVVVERRPRQHLRPRCIVRQTRPVLMWVPPAMDRRPFLRLAHHVPKMEAIPIVLKK